MPLSQVQGGTSCFYFFLRPSAFRMLQSRVLQLHLTFDHCPTSSIPLKTLSWVFVSYYSANRLSLISWGTPLFFFFFPLFPNPLTPENRGAADVGIWSFLHVNEEVLLQGIFIWVCLALDLTSPPLHYKEVGLQAAGLSTKPIFFPP